ncbi:MAG: hypothetical protein NT040_10140 [Bacteroidetes bacterium]|nr:hypothetical protein [Bacteroidota bacterium]
MTSVHARLSAPDDTFFEEGPCVVELPSGKYGYATIRPVPVTSGVNLEITLRDIPGNVTRQSFTLQPGIFPGTGKERRGR